MSSALVSPPVVKPKSLSCPNCGGPIELRGFAHTLSVVCPQCLSVLDSSTPELAILATFQGKQRIQPLIPLGSRGTLGGTVFEAIGFQRREVQEEDQEETASFGWNEYLLFNPYKGFRYLSEYNNHWNFIRALSSLPEAIPATGKETRRYQSQRYALFDTAHARTAFVLGEFPWRAQVGDQVFVKDYIAAPLMLSSEATGSEVTWSQGEYWTSQQIWQAFRLPGSAPRPTGIFANQPSPYTGKTGRAWRLWFGWMAALVALAAVIAVSAPRAEVFRQHYTFTPGTASNAAFVTDPFEVAPSHISNLEILTRTDLRGNWAYFNFTLVNETTGSARDFGREISHYSDEGSPNDSVILPDVPAGKYYLRVEPEMQSGAGGSEGVSYDLIARRGVPKYGWLWLAALLLSVPPIFTGVRAAGFETRRWRESDLSQSGPSMISGLGGDS